MPQLNKVQVRDLVRQLIDDPAGKQWPTARLDLLIEGCLDELYGQLIDEFEWIRWTETTETPIAPGVLELWDDSANTSFVRLYRIQKVIRDETEYQPTPASNIIKVGSTVISAPDRTYTLLGRTMHLFPYDTTPVTVQYNSLPEPFTSLSPGPDPDEDDVLSFVEWPDGHHMAYIYDIAAKAMEKGDKEDSTRLTRRAEHSMHRLKAFLRKWHAGPIMPRFTDGPEHWGGI